MSLESLKPEQEGNPNINERVLSSAEIVENCKEKANSLLKGLEGAILLHYNGVSPTKPEVNSIQDLTPAEIQDVVERYDFAFEYNVHLITENFRTWRDALSINDTKGYEALHDAKDEFLNMSQIRGWHL